MTLSGLLQLPQQLGLRSSQRCSTQQKRQDSWGVPHSDYIHWPMRLGTTRGISFSCHSFNVAGKTFEFYPAVKAASSALTRSCNFFQSCPLVLQLVPAVGLFVFSLWGLVPVVRQSRNLLLNRSDNSWKKSSTHHMINSYVQPLLLWIGALYICRIIDPVVLPTEASQLVKNRLLNFVRSLSTVLALAYCLSSMVQQTQKFLMETTDPTDARNMGFQFAGKAVYSAVWVAAVSLFMELLGFSTQRWLTAGGLGTVLLTLAGREIFTNFLSSIMIHATRPFVMNEWIQTKIEGYDVSGTVEHVGWWSPTVIRGEDREAIHIPNHKFTVNVVRNLTQKTHWRIKTHLAISHLDVNKINNIVADMRKVLAKNPLVEQQRLHRRVFLDNINPENQALLILISCFVKTSHHEEYLCVKEAIIMDLLRVISHHRARLATPIRTVQKMYSDPNMDNIPFADSVYESNGAAAKRPLLLVEPSYKINEEKTKSQNRFSRVDNKQKSKGVEISTPDAKTESKAGFTTKADPKSKETKANAKSGEMPNADTKVVEEGNSFSRSVPRKNVSGVSPGSHPSVPKLSLEENIVLGVALDGSKRSLPIEEGVGSAAQVEDEELTAASQSGNTTGSREDNKLETQLPHPGNAERSML